MKTFNIFYTIKGPAGIIRTPNNPNPVEAESLSAVLEALKGSPLFVRKSLYMPVEIIGVSIEENREDESEPQTIGPGSWIA